MEKTTKIGKKRFRKRVKYGRRFFKRSLGKSLSLVTRGKHTSQHKYTMFAAYGFDSNYAGGYIYSFQRGGSIVNFVASGSVNPSNAGLGFVSTFQFPTGRAGMTPNTVIPFCWILASGYVGPSSFNANLAKYKYFKIAGVTLKVASIVAGSTGTIYTSASPPVIIPQLSGAISVLPNLYFNCIDNAGMSSSLGNTNYDDIGVNASYDAWGYSQRSKGSMRYRPHATNDMVSKKAFFKFGNWCMGPQYIYDGTSYRTIAGLGHWNPSLTFGAGDPLNTDTPYLNGGIIAGSEPSLGLGASFQNTNYQNLFVPVAELEVIVHVDWMGEYDFTYNNIQ